MNPGGPDPRGQAWSLDGKAALITGGSKGIGLAVAGRFLAAGARVTIVARHAESLAAAKETLIRLGHAPEHIMTFKANAGSVRDAEDCTSAALDFFGRLDILVNNAAANPYFGPLMGLDAARAEKTAAVNQFGPIRWAQCSWKLWMECNGGVIINVASLGGLIVDEGIAYYNATKAALIHLTRHLAAELAPDVRVNGIAPGIVRTDMAKALWEPNEDAFREALPLGRIGEPDDIAGPALFLASDMSSWMTGHILVVDGGSSVVPADRMVHGFSQPVTEPTEDTR